MHRWPLMLAGCHTSEIYPAIHYASILSLHSQTLNEERSGFLMDPWTLKDTQLVRQFRILWFVTLSQHVQNIA